MCGICGGSGPGAEQWVSNGNILQYHRGPDHAALTSASGFTLGITRLAIVDLTEGGNQPLASRDGTITAVFNGELYNYRQLVRDHRLEVTSGNDGAVIPELYRRYGSAGLRFLRGMFAVAILDRARRRLVLARDPLGIKPLHWCRGRDGEIYFASEPRSLVGAVGGPELSRRSLIHFLRYGHVPAHESPFSGIESLKPNECVELAPDRGVIARSAVRQNLWSGIRSSGEDLGESLIETVRAHLRSDVPMALLLSSGIDSAAIAWAASRCAGSLDCFTVDVAGMNSESKAAAELAWHFGHRHSVISHEFLADDMTAFIRRMQRPSIDGLNTFVVCRAVAAQGIKVALSGLGGDEALGGYHHFRLLPLLRPLSMADRWPLYEAMSKRLPRVGALANSKVRELLGPEGPRDAAGLSCLQRRLFDPADVSALVGYESSDHDPSEGNGGAGRRAAVDLSLAELRGYLQGMLLPDADAFSMASSVELRVPLVDVEFLRVALSVAPLRGVGKRQFANILGDRLLRRCAARPKQGFSVPMDLWMRRGALARPVADLDDPSAPLWEHVDQAAGRRVLTRWRHSGRWSEAWALVVLNAWIADVSAARSTAPPVPAGGSPCAE